MTTLAAAPTKKYHQQNEFGLSFNGMIVLAIRNSDTAIKSEFCERAASIKDIYTFLKTHIFPFRDMSQTEWKKCERVIRHSLSQTTYFHRFQIEQDGSAKIIPSKAAGAEKGALWTIFPAPGEDKEKAERRIKKVFKAEHVETFKELLFNPMTVEKILDGTHGWFGPYGEPLAPSDAKRKLEIQLSAADADAYKEQPDCKAAAGVLSTAKKPAKRVQKKPKSEQKSVDAAIPQCTNNLRKRKAHTMLPEQREAEEMAPSKKVKLENWEEEGKEQIVRMPFLLLADEVAMAKYNGMTWNKWQRAAIKNVAGL